MDMCLVFLKKIMHMYVQAPCTMPMRTQYLPVAVAQLFSHTDYQQLP